MQEEADLQVVTSAEEGALVRVGLSSVAGPRHHWPVCIHECRLACRPTTRATAFQNWLMSFGCTQAKVDAADRHVLVGSCACCKLPSQW